MRRLGILLLLMMPVGSVVADNDHTCQGGHNCNTDGGGDGVPGVVVTTENGGASITSEGIQAGATFDSDYLALGLSDFGEATRVDGCHESRGSLGALSIGSGGKTKINQTCFCTKTAMRLIELGQVALGVDMLAQCDLVRAVDKSLAVTTTGERETGCQTQTEALISKEPTSKPEPGACVGK